MDLLSNTLMRELKKQNDILMNENMKLKTKMNLMKKINELLTNIKSNLEHSLESIISLNVNSIKMPDDFQSNSLLCTQLGQQLDLIVNQFQLLHHTHHFVDCSDSDKSSVNHLQPIHLDNQIINVMKNEEKRQSCTTKAKYIKKLTTKPRVKYICEWPECGFNTTNNSLLADHMPSHTTSSDLLNDHTPSQTQKKFECAFPNCGKKFDKCSDLKQHVITHDNTFDQQPDDDDDDDDLLQCCESDCQFQSNDLELFRQHLIEHNQEKTFICNHLGCDDKFATIDSLLEHSRTHKPPKKQKKFSCHYDDCNEDFDNFQQLYSHRSQHKASSSTNNSVGNKNRSPSEKFMKMISVSGITYYTCIWTNCVYKSQIKFDVLRHIRTHTGERPYGCKYPGCGMRFKDSAHLATHRMIHTGEKPFKCSFCPYTTRSNSYLKKHHLTHKNGKRCTFPCTNCRLKFLTVNDLKEHNKTHHNNEQSIKCDVDGCGQNFRSDKELEDHMEWHKTSEAKVVIEAKVPFVCNFEKCNKRFETEEKLAEHYFGHINTADRPYRCEYEECGKRFKNNEQLKIHKRTHTNERPYVCENPDCGKRFKTGGQLTNHLRIHSGEKPYLCDIEGCVRKFATKSQLIHHKKLHTCRSKGLTRRYTNHRNSQ